MALFEATQLTFAQAFVAPPSRAIRIASDAAATPLTSGEAQTSAGCYAFDAGDRLENRFIVWRAAGSTLFLEERWLDASFPCSPSTYSITLTFVRNRVIAGTRLFAANGMLNLVVPTVSGLHRFFVRIADERVEQPSGAILASFPDGDQLAIYHDEFALSASSDSPFQADIVGEYDGRTLAVFAMIDGNLNAVQMAPFGARKGSRTTPMEFHLRHDGVISRIWRGGRRADGVAGVIAVADRFGTHIYAVYRDAQLRIWSAKSQRKCCDVSLLEYSETADRNAVVQAVKIRSSFVTGQLFLIVYLLYEDSNSFLILVPSTDNSRIAKVVDVEGRNMELLDFAYASNRDQPALVGLYRDAKKQVVLMRKIIDPSSVHHSPWSIVRADVAIRAAREITDHPDSLAAMKARLFNADHYSFDVVQRALQLACKQMTLNVASDDWRGLERAVQIYLQSPQFSQHYSARNERSSLSLTRVSDDADTIARRFWTLALNSVEELHEAASIPLAIWIAEPLDIFGVILQNRLTVYHPVDAQLTRFNAAFANTPALVLELVTNCFDCAMKFVAGEAVSDLEMVTFGEEFVVGVTVICDLVRKFLRAVSPSATSAAAARGQSRRSIYGGQFTAGLLAAGLLQAVQMRFTFLQRVAALVLLVEHRKMTTLNEQWQKLVAEKHKTIKRLQRAYGILWKTLTIRVRNDETATASDPYLTVAFALFEEVDGLLGDARVNQTRDGSAASPDAMSISAEDEDDDEDGEDRDGPRVQGEEEGNFRGFFDRAICTALATIWPDCEELAIARFLARKKHYTALLRYLELNEEDPYPERLRFAIRYYRGIANTGIGDPKTGLSEFLHALDGIESGDTVLNAALVDGDDKEVRLHSTSEYLIKVMAFFEADGHTTELVEAGRVALKKAKAQDPHLAFIHTLLFKHELAGEHWADALRTLRANPSGESQRNCLRQLIARFLDCDGGGKRVLDLLVKMDYGDVEAQVVEVLEKRAASLEVARACSIYETLFAFHMWRTNFRKAAISMYTLATRLERDACSASAVRQRVRALAVVEQCLSLLPEDDYRWIAVPRYHGSADDDDDDVEAEGGEGGSTSACAPLSYVTVEELRKQYAVAEARLHLMTSAAAGGETASEMMRKRRKGFNVPVTTAAATSPLSAIRSATVSPGPAPIATSEVLEALVRKCHFDKAIILACSLDLPVYDILEALTMECLTADATVGGAGGDTTTVAWINDNRLHHTDATPADERGWAILRGHVAALMKSRGEEKTRILRTVTACFLAIGRMPPIWLVAQYKIDAANDAMVVYIDGVLGTLTSGDARTWLPYSTIDDLLVLNAKAKAKPQGTGELRSKLDKYFERLNAFSAAGSYYRRTTAITPSS